MQYVAEEGLQAGLAEFLLMLVIGFNDAVRIEDEAVAGLKWMFQGGEGGRGKSRQDEAVFDDFSDGSVAQEEHRRVAGGGVVEETRRSVQVDVSGGNELVLCVATECIVHASEKGCWVGCFGAQRGGGYLDHGGNESRGHAVAGDVGDEEAGLVPSATRKS